MKTEVNVHYLDVAMVLRYDTKSMSKEKDNFHFTQIYFYFCIIEMTVIKMPFTSLKQH